MKKLSFLAVVIFLFGCTEVPPVIDFSEPVLLATDTTYITRDLPQNVKKNVLIEDISGVRCNNCPKAADIAHDIQDKYPNRIAVLTLHSNRYGPFTAPYPESKDTFNTVEATEIVSNLIGEPSGLPAGAIDRKVFAGKTSKINQQYETWESQVVEQLALTPKADLELELIKQQGREIIANVKATVLAEDPSATYLSVFIVESHIKSKQKMPDNTYDKDYLHNSILRKAVTNYAGVKLADNVEVGRVFEKGFVFTIPEKYDINYCSIVVLINKNEQATTEVVQSIEKSIE